MTEAEFLNAVRDSLITQLKTRNETLCAMMEEAMAVFDRYLNVPESVALRKRWESFKNSP